MHYSDKIHNSRDITRKALNIDGNRLKIKELRTQTYLMNVIIVVNILQGAKIRR